MRRIKRQIVAAMIFSGDGKLFLGKKSLEKGGVYPDCWHIPGGGVEKGENNISALKREVMEETGLEIGNLPILLVDDEGKGESEKTLEDGEKVICEMEFAVYKVLIDLPANETDINLGSDLAEYRWTDLSDLSKLKLTPPSINLFKRLEILK